MITIDPSSKVYRCVLSAVCLNDPNPCGSSLSLSDVLLQKLRTIGIKNFILALAKGNRHPRAKTESSRTMGNCDVKESLTREGSRNKHSQEFSLAWGKPVFGLACVWGVVTGALGWPAGRAQEAVVLAAPCPHLTHFKHRTTTHPGLRTQRTPRRRRSHPPPISQRRGGAGWSGAGQSSRAFRVANGSGRI